MGAEEQAPRAVRAEARREAPMSRCARPCQMLISAGGRRLKHDVKHLCHAVRDLRCSPWPAADVCLSAVADGARRLGKLHLEPNSSLGEKRSPNGPAASLSHTLPA